MENEEWRPIKNYEGHYEISNFGKVASLNYRGSGKRQNLKTNINENGYEQVRLNVNKTGVNKKVHRLVAEAFLPNLENKKCVNHKDGNKSNNNFFNLEWSTHSENTKHAFENNFIPIITGENTIISKLKNEEVVEIFLSNKSHRSLAKEYNVTKNTITSIKSRRTWKKITQDL